MLSRNKDSQTAVEGTSRLNPQASAAMHNQNMPVSARKYKDGTYTGNAAETLYGNVQIAVVVNGGKITDVKYLQMPFAEERSQSITDAAKPLLKATTIDKQSANIDFVTGATSTSFGYQESLQAALDQAAKA